MDRFQMYDKHKKGTIILSHYRSGGTQLLLSLKEVLRINDISYDNLGEWDFDTLSGNWNNALDFMFYDWTHCNSLFYDEIENDMNENNSLSKSRRSPKHENTRKKREELSMNAVKTFRQEKVEIIVRFN